MTVIRRWARKVFKALGSVARQPAVLYRNSHFGMGRRGRAEVRVLLLSAVVGWRVSECPVYMLSIRTEQLRGLF
jgi:hypothetical protein